MTKLAARLNTNVIDFIKLMDPKVLRVDDSDEFFKDDDWLAETKKNGRRIQCLISDDVYFAGRYGRNAKEKIHDFRWKFYKIYDDIKKMNLPSGTLLDGEVYLPGQPTKTFQIINSDTDKSVTLQRQHGFLKYTIFDLLFFNNQSLIENTLDFRKKKLASIIPTAFNVDVIECFTKEKAKRKLWNDILNSLSKEKGIVFKLRESEYESKRSHCWKKMKHVQTFDGVIMQYRFDLNDQKRVVSIDIGQYVGQRLIKVANIAGLTNEQRNDLESNEKKYKGQVVQFKADFQTDYSYKNPRFDRVRFDKRPQSCVWPES